MPKHWRLTAGLLLALASAPAWAQSPGAASQGGLLVKTSRGTVLLFNQYKGGSFSFRVTLDAKAEVRPTSTPGQYTANGQQLYLNATPSAAFQAGSDTATLGRFARSEMRRLLNTMPLPIRPFVRQFTDQPTGRRCFVWGYDMAEVLDRSLDGVVYLYLLDGAHLITLAGTQPKGLPLHQTLNVLIAAV